MKNYRNSWWIIWKHENESFRNTKTYERESLDYLRKLDISEDAIVLAKHSESMKAICDPLNSSFDVHIKICLTLNDEIF